MSVDRATFYDHVPVEPDQQNAYAMQYRSLHGDRLTPREREVILLVGQGMTDQEVATQLCLSVRTVQNHLHRSYNKLRVNNRTAAVQLVMRKQAAKERGEA
ncbi:MAG TPA: LuxR C-terminal-related transcriptional regulator [Herpetosiphonaceae bacterium]